MSRVPPAGYLSHLSRQNWPLALAEAYCAIRSLQDEVRQRNPSHPLLGLVAVTEEAIELTADFEDFRQRVANDARIEDTQLYAVGRYLERLGLVLA